MRTATLPALTPAQTATYARDGFVVVRDLLSPASVAGLRAVLARAAARVLSELRTGGAIPPGPDGAFEDGLCVAGVHADRYGRSWRDLVAGPEVYALHRDPALLGAITALAGGPAYGTSVFNARPKLPGQRLTEVPWHQDLAYFPEDGRERSFVTAWTPAVPVDAGNGCMRVWAGSHRRGLQPHRRMDDAAGFLALPEPPAGAAVATCAMLPGDVLFMHHLVWHGSGANTSRGIRWSIDLRFTADPVLEDMFPAPWRLDGPDATDRDTWLGWWRRAA